MILTIRDPHGVNAFVVVLVLVLVLVVFVLVTTFIFWEYFCACFLRANTCL